MRTRMIAVVLAGMVALAACSSGSSASSGDGLPDDATISYAFFDSSVPPEYHRSETLTVTKDEAHLVIDSYGDVLADQTVATPAAVWEELGATLPALTELAVDPLEEACDGGTSMGLEVATPNETIVNLQPDFCGGSNSSLEAPIQAWVAPARDLFASTEELAPEGE